MLRHFVTHMCGHNMGTLRPHRIEKIGAQPDTNQQASALIRIRSTT